MNILVVGVGNMLRADDGFGVAVANRLLERAPQPGVTVVETGIAGIQLVQDLMETSYDAVIVVDTVDRDRAPGTVMVIDAEVVDVDTLGHNEKYDLLADMHLATPERSLMVANALKVLPAIVYIVGCQPVDAETPRIGLTEAVEGAIEPAIDEIDRLIAELRSRSPAGGRAQ